MIAIYIIAGLYAVTGVVYGVIVSIAISDIARASSDWPKLLSVCAFFAGFFFWPVIATIAMRKGRR